MRRKNDIDFAQLIAYFAERHTRWEKKTKGVRTPSRHVAVAESLSPSSDHV